MVPATATLDALPRAVSQQKELVLDQRETVMTDELTYVFDGTRVITDAEGGL
jgi:hypothetical protein